MQPITPNSWAREQTRPPAPSLPGTVLSQQIYVIDVDGSRALVSRKVITPRGVELQPAVWLDVARLCPIEPQPPVSPRVLLRYGRVASV